MNVQKFSTLRVNLALGWDNPGTHIVPLSPGCYYSQKEISVYIWHLMKNIECDTKVLLWEHPDISYHLHQLSTWCYCSQVSFQWLHSMLSQQNLLPCLHALYVRLFTETPQPTGLQNASHDSWCTGTLLNRIITAQWEGIGDVGSPKYELALLPPCLTIRVLSPQVDSPPFAATVAAAPPSIVLPGRPCPPTIEFKLP